MMKLETRTLRGVASGRALLDLFPGVRILVVGDVMLDEYLAGRADRIAPEAPVPVVAVESEEARLGGAANVAHNARALECAVEAAGVIGADAAGDAVIEGLRRSGATYCAILRDPSRPTTRKTRVMVGDQVVARHDHESRAPLSPDVERRLCSALARGPADVVVLSDYGKGAVTPAVIERVVAHAKANRAPLLVATKRRDLERYRGASALFLNANEASAALGLTFEGDGKLGAAGREILDRTLDRLDLQALCVTRAEAGAVLVERGRTPQALRAEAARVRDVTGAGDTFLAAVAAAVGAGSGYLEAARLAGRAAGIAVGKSRVAVVSANEIGAALAAPERVFTVETMAAIASRLREAGETIVFTNGCFDLLHPGHVACLERARSLGDVLVVGLNSDASVRRLKGPERPVHAEAERARMLGALRSVDYVVLFDDDTPARLIEAVRPHVLVKGGNYALDQVAGREIVERHGGRVELIDLVPGCSSTALLRRIQDQGVERKGGT